MAATRSGMAAGTAAALALASCGGAETLTLPSDPVDRAATCAVVAAAEARVATPNVQAPLPLEAHGRILHYALLAAAEGGEFRRETANAVGRRVGELHESVTEGKWKDLQPVCAEAFPAAEKRQVELPTVRYEAQIACEELADFLGTALMAQEVNYVNEFAGWNRLRRELNDAIAPTLGRRAGSSRDAQQRERDRALAAAARIGSPVPVLAQCMERFGRSS